MGETHDATPSGWQHGQGHGPDVQTGPQVFTPLESHIPTSTWLRGRMPTPPQTSMSHSGAAYGIGSESTVNRMAQRE
eukprot:9318476-Prorocentrum_lima.AAC.1